MIDLVCLMVDSGSLNFVSRSFIDGVCVVPLAPAAMTMSGSTFHPKLHMSFSIWLVLLGFIFNFLL